MLNPIIELPSNLMNGTPCFIGGAVADVLCGRIILPFFVIGTGIFIGGIYHATDVIDINKL
ncbi:MAG TPA: hypothetical protein PLD88_01295 [Candidatus Berkiella sp.]|nr:hypothetical protein [Candidatus Berkiella sp.]